MGTTLSTVIELQERLKKENRRQEGMAAPALLGPLPPLPLFSILIPARPTQGETVDPLAENNRERICRAKGKSGSYERVDPGMIATKKLQ